MKILFSANGYPTPEYPLQSFIGELCRELTRQGHEVTVVAPVSILSFIKHGIKLPPLHFTENVKTAEGIKEINIYRPYVLSPGEGRFIKLSSWLTQKVVGLFLKIQNRQYDILYSHFWSSALNIVDYLKSNNTPLFVATGEDEINLDYLRSTKNINYLKTRTSGVICVSTKNKNESIEKGLTSAIQCVVLPNAVNATDFHQTSRSSMRKKLGFSNEDFIVCFCGRFNHRKGFQRVSDAITKCNDKAIKSIFIGKPVEGESVYPSCDGILYCGVVAHENIPEYLNASDVFVLPSLAEGCSNSIVEAMACGLPIISSNLPFNYDILDDSNSIMLDPLNVDEIADAIFKLKDDNEIRISMGQRSLEKASDLSLENRTHNIIGFVNIKLNK